MTTGKPDDQGHDAAKIATIAAAVLGTIFAGVAFATHGPRAAASVFAGATIAVANLVTMSAIIRALLRAPDEEVPPVEPVVEGEAKQEEEEEEEPKPDHVAAGKRGGAAWGGFAVVKILVLFGGIWMLLTKGLVDPIPLVVGYGVLPLGIAGSSLLGSLAPRRNPASRTARRKK